MAPRKQKHARSKTTLPPQLAAANLHAAASTSGRSPLCGGSPSDDPQPVRCFAAYTADLEGPYTAAQPSNGKELGCSPRYTPGKQWVV